VEILITTRPNFFKHKLGYIMGCIVFAIIGFICLSIVPNISVLPNVFGIVLGIYFIGLGVFMFAWGYLYYNNITLTIDEEKSIKKMGIFSKSINEVKHVDVRNIQIRQGFFDRMFDIGSVYISSAAQSGVEMSVDGISEYSQIKDLLNKKRNELESINKETVSKETVSKETVNNERVDNNIAEQIKQISELRDQKILTEEEFQKKKEDLLTKM